MACTVIPTKIPTIDKTAIPTNKYQQYQPRGGGMIPIPEKWLVYDWYTTLENPANLIPAKYQYQKNCW